MAVDDQTTGPDGSTGGVCKPPSRAFDTVPFKPALTITGSDGGSGVYFEQ